MGKERFDGGRSRERAVQARRSEEGRGFTNSPFRSELDRDMLLPKCLVCQKAIRKFSAPHGYMHAECERTVGPFATEPGPGNWPRKKGKRADWDPLVTEALPGSDQLLVLKASDVYANTEAFPEPVEP